jgi:hypothetical protein
MLGLSLLLALALLLGACSTDPEGTRLALQTDAVQGSPEGCSLGAIPPVRIDREDGDMVFEDVATGVRRSITWPFGFAAWLEFDMAVLYASDGTVVGREGDVLGNIGGAVIEGEAFRVCSVGARTYR